MREVKKTSNADVLLLDMCPLNGSLAQLILEPNLKEKTAMVMIIGAHNNERSQKNFERRCFVT